VKRQLLIKTKSEAIPHDFKSPKRLLDEEIPIIHKALTHCIDLVEQSILDINHFQLSIAKGEFELIKFSNLQHQLVDYSCGWIGRVDSNFARFGCFWSQDTFSALLYTSLKGTIEGIKHRVLTRKNLITDIEISIIEESITKHFIKNLYYSLVSYGNKKPRIHNIETSLNEMKTNFDPYELVLSFPITFHWKDHDSQELITKALFVFNQQFLREYNWRAI